MINGLIFKMLIGCYKWYIDCFSTLYYILSYFMIKDFLHIPADSKKRRLHNTFIIIKIIDRYSSLLHKYFFKVRIITRTKIDCYQSYFNGFDKFYRDKTLSFQYEQFRPD